MAFERTSHAFPLSASPVFSYLILYEPTVNDAWAIAVIAAQAIAKTKRMRFMII